MPRQRFLCFLFSLFLLALPTFAAAQNGNSPQIEDFSESSLVIASAKYLGATAESMGEIIDRIFSRYGSPSAVIRGEEVSFSVVFARAMGAAIYYFPTGAKCRFIGAGPPPVSIWARRAAKALRWFITLTGRKTFIAALPVLTARWSRWAASALIICSAATQSSPPCASASVIKSVSASAI